MPVMFEEFNSSSGGDGSYTLAFPPDYASGAPTCFLDGMDIEVEEGGPPDIPDSGLPPGADGGPPGMDPTGGTGGCGCSSAGGPADALPILGALTLLWLTRRRRR